MPARACGSSSCVATQLARADASKALAAGLTFRPLEETVVDTLAWDRTVEGDRPTLTREKERIALGATR